MSRVSLSSLWAARIAAATPLPDARLRTRLGRLLTHLAEKPLDGIPQALPDSHQAKAACRLIANHRVQADHLQLGLHSATVAVRLLRMRNLARTEPTAPCTEVLTDDELRALQAHITGETPTAASRVPTIEQVTKWLGRLGRKSDGMPGVRTLWRGWRDLAILVAGYRAGRRKQ